MAEYNPTIVDNLYQLSNGGLGTLSGYKPQSSELINTGNTETIPYTTPQYGISAATVSETPTAPKAEGNWYDFFTKGGGSSELTPKELQQYATISTGLANEQDPQIREQLLQQKQNLLSGTQDRGGLFGSLGRVATGQGQTTGENAATLAGTFILPLVKAYLNQRATNSMSNKVRNQYQQNQAMMQNNVNNILGR